MKRTLRKKDENLNFVNQILNKLELKLGGLLAEAFCEEDFAA